MRIGLRIAADVVFYIVPAEGRRPLAMAARAQERFRKLIVGLTEEFKKRPLIIAYSQGTMIAANALAAMGSAEQKFITAGSPIDTLYKNFLGIEDKLELSTWENFYRPSDFVGGRVPEADPGNVPISSHHMNYLSEAALRDAIVASFQPPSPPMPAAGTVDHNWPGISVS